MFYLKTKNTEEDFCAFVFYKRFIGTVPITENFCVKSVGQF